MRHFIQASSMDDFVALDRRDGLADALAPKPAAAK
jgi:hypothetical protein